MKTKLLIVPIIAIIGFNSCKEQETTSMDAEIRASQKETANVSATTTYNVTPSTVLNTAFWDGVQASLASGPVDVIFANGTYTRTSTILLKDKGHSTNLLTLKTASTQGGAVFTGTISTPLISVSTSKNIRILRLKFTGNVTGYAVTVTGSRDITVDYCQFIDLQQVYYGALGVNTDCNNVIVKYNTFTRIGVGTTAHMVYGAYRVKRLKIIKNTFTDCAGSFVRFRGDVTTQGVVYSNTFKSTGTYRSGSNPIFIEVPVFNDVNPGDERFGTKFMVTKNTFNYPTIGNQNTRFAMVFHHSGYNPPERTHLVSAWGGSTLHSGTVAEKRSIMTNSLGLNGEEIRFGGNTNYNVQYNVSYRCQGGYGAVAPWTGVASIGTAVSTSGLATTEAQALTYYDDLN